jgi:hypothetical protein
MHGHSHVSSLAGILVALLAATSVLADPPREVDLAEYGDAAIFEGTVLDDALGGVRSLHATSTRMGSMTS